MESDINDTININDKTGEKDNDIKELLTKVVVLALVLVLVLNERIDLDQVQNQEEERVIKDAVKDSLEGESSIREGASIFGGDISSSREGANTFGGDISSNREGAKSGEGDTNTNREGVISVEGISTKTSTGREGVNSDREGVNSGGEGADKELRRGRSYRSGKDGKGRLEWERDTALLQGKFLLLPKGI